MSLVIFVRQLTCRDSVISLLLYLYKSRYPSSIMAKKAFGGYQVSFKGRKETAEEIFGRAPLAPSAMTKKIWVYIKRHKLAGK